MNHDTFTEELIQKAQHAFIKHGTHEKVASGTKVIVEGDLTEYLYYVSEGDLKTFGVASVYPIFLGAIKSEQVFGEASFLLGGRTASATVMAVKDCDLYKISYEKLTAILKKNDQEAVAIMFFLAHMFAIRIRRMDVSVFKPGMVEDHILPE